MTKPKFSRPLYEPVLSAKPGAGGPASAIVLGLQNRDRYAFPLGAPDRILRSHLADPAQPNATSSSATSTIRWFRL